MLRAGESVKGELSGTVMVVLERFWPAPPEEAVMVIMAFWAVWASTEEAKRAVDKTRLRSIVAVIPDVGGLDGLS